MKADTTPNSVKSTKAAFPLSANSNEANDRLLAASIYFDAPPALPPLSPDHENAEFDANDFASTQHWVQRYANKSQSIKEDTIDQDRRVKNNELRQIDQAKKNRISQDKLEQEWTRNSTHLIGQQVKWDFVVERVTIDCVLVEILWHHGDKWLLTPFLQVRFKRDGRRDYGIGENLGGSKDGLGIGQHISSKSALKLEKDDKISIQGDLESVRFQDGFVEIVLSNAHASNFDPNQITNKSDLLTKPAPRKDHSDSTDSISTAYTIF